jgi:pimeloyl-ACP methyl ester carboxylesterase
MLTQRTLSWQREGELVEIEGRRIFTRRRDGSGPLLLLLHGYPSSSYDWRHAFALPGERRTASFDFLGYGLSDKPRDHRYSLHAQADLAEAIVSREAPESVVLVAHDMGSSVATELLARDLEGRLSFKLDRVLLFNASLVLERASLTVSQKLLRSRLGPLAARLTNKHAFRAQFARIFSDAHPLSPEEAGDQWALLTYNDGHRLLDRLVFYLHERITFASRWHGALRDWPGPLELAWAERDPICTEAVLQAVLALRPHARVSRLPELGHYPQLEDPAAANAIVERVAAEGSGAGAGP